MKATLPKETILVADDHPLVRAGIRAALEQTATHEIVGECRGCAEVLQQLLKLSPSLLVLDILMGQDCSLEWLDRYQSACPGLRILTISSLKSSESLSLLDHPTVHGYVLKEEASEHLVQAVRVVASGGTWFSSPIAAELRRMAEARRHKPSYQLSPREQQVFQRIKAAQDNASIAAALGLSVHTVRRNISNIYSKLGVSGRVEAIVRG